MFHVCQTWGERSLFGELIDCAAGLAGVVVRGDVFVSSERLDRCGIARNADDHGQFADRNAAALGGLSAGSLVRSGHCALWAVAS